MYLSGVSRADCLLAAPAGLAGCEMRFARFHCIPFGIPTLSLSYHSYSSLLLAAEPIIERAFVAARISFFRGELLLLSFVFFS